jgi:hypothetical protein
MRSSELAPTKLEGMSLFALMAKVVAFAPLNAESPSSRDVRGLDGRSDAPARRRGLFERLDHWFWRQQQRGVEAYLAKATDVYDLEARIRALERNVPHPYY